MANVHVLRRLNGNFELVIHIAVPNANNAAGVNWRTALLNADIGGTTNLPDGDGTGGTISAAEKSSVASGAVYEQTHLLDVTQGGNLTSAAQINAYVDQWFAATSSVVLADLQRQLNQFGRTR